MKHFMLTTAVLAGALALSACDRRDDSAPYSQPAPPADTTVSGSDSYSSGTDTATVPPTTADTTTSNATSDTTATTSTTATTGTATNYDSAKATKAHKKGKIHKKKTHTGAHLETPSENRDTGYLLDGSPADYERTAEDEVWDTEEMDASIADESEFVGSESSSSMVSEPSFAEEHARIQSNAARQIDWIQNRIEGLKFRRDTGTRPEVASLTESIRQIEFKLNDTQAELGQLGKSTDPFYGNKITASINSLWTDLERAEQQYAP